jgi:flagellin-like hook-associated protein FlgL
MSIDWAIDVGHVFTALSIVAAGIAVFMAMRADLRHLSSRMGSIEDAVEKLTDILATCSAQKERLDGHTTRLDRLERQVDEYVAGN